MILCLLQIQYSRNTSIGTEWNISGMSIYLSMLYYTVAFPVLISQCEITMQNSNGNTCALLYFLDYLVQLFFSFLNYPMNLNISVATFIRVADFGFGNSDLLIVFLLFRCNFYGILFLSYFIHSPIGSFYNC